MFRVVAVAVAVLGSLWTCRAGGSDERTTAAERAGPDTCALFDHSHAAWTAILNRYMKEGFVDYAGTFEVLKKAGFQGWVVVETDVTQKSSALESATISRRHLQRLGL